jgi:hypothetical protein
MCIIVLFCINVSHAQTAKDVLENGRRVKSSDVLFLKKDGDALKHRVGRTFIAPVSLPDSVILMAEDDELNVYIKPFNPLKFGYQTKNVVIDDPLTVDEKAASQSIFDAIAKIGGLGNKMGEATADDDCASFTNIYQALLNLKDSLKDDRKKRVNEIFEAMQDLTFDDAKNTISAVKDADNDIKLLEQHFLKIDSMLKELNVMIGMICIKPTESDSMAVFSFTEVLKAKAKEIETLKSEQQKRLTNLRSAYKLVNDMVKLADVQREDAYWMIPLPSVAATTGKVSLYTITINEAGYKFSDDKEIVTREKKELINRTVRVRKFDRWITEVSGGIAYTRFDYPEYGVTQDAAGNNVVGLIKNNDVKNIKFSAMVNFNYFISHSKLVPFVQIGIGANSEIPTFMVGAGGRFNFSGLRRIAIATGYAGTWIKELKTLKVGQTVTNASDVDKDLGYEFHWPLRPYFAIQYNF